MGVVKKYRYKPIYKKFIKLKENVQNKQKLLKFKKQKWNNFIVKINRLSKYKKRNCFYKFYDQNSYKINRYNGYFSRNYKESVTTKKRFNLFYGSLNRNYLKKLIAQSLKYSNQIENKINYRLFFLNSLENRLDIILVRSNLVLTVRNARQLILHGHVLVNKKVVHDSSYLVRKGDCITFSQKIHSLIQYYVLMSEMWPIPPSFLQISYKLLQIQIVDNSLFSNNLANLYLWLDLSNLTKSYFK